MRWRGRNLRRDASDDASLVTHFALTMQSQDMAPLTAVLITVKLFTARLVTAELNQ